MEIDSTRAMIKIRLRRRTGNHAGSMYFPVLAVGADCAVGLLAVESINRHREKVTFIFRNFSADFYRRATGDVHFICTQGAEIDQLVERAIRCGERVENTLDVAAIVPSESNEPVARFSLTLSLKKK